MNRKTVAFVLLIVVLVGVLTTSLFIYFGDNNSNNNQNKKNEDGISTELNNSINNISSSEKETSVKEEQFEDKNDTADKKKDRPTLINTDGYINECEVDDVNDPRWNPEYEGNVMLKNGSLLINYGLNSYTDRIKLQIGVSDFLKKLNLIGNNYYNMNIISSDNDIDTSADIIKFSLKIEDINKIIDVYYNTASAEYEYKTRDDGISSSDISYKNITINNKNILLEHDLTAEDINVIQSTVFDYLSYYQVIKYNDIFNLSVIEDKVTNNGDDYYFSFSINGQSYRLECVYNKVKQSCNVECLTIEKQYKINQLGREGK